MLQNVISFESLDLLYKSWKGVAFGYKTLGLPDNFSPKCYAPTDTFRLLQEFYNDESEEDYLYPESYFVPIELPKAAEKAFSLASSTYRKPSDRPTALRASYGRRCALHNLVHRFWA